MPPKRKSHIERLKEKIYSPKTPNLNLKERGKLHEREHEVSDKWAKDETVKAPPKKRKSLLGNTMFRRFLLGAALFFVLAVGFGLLMFFGGRNTVSADNIDIAVNGNAFVSGGEDLPLKIVLTNRNNVSLEYADLILQYQQGSGDAEELRSDRVTVGTIPAGGKVEKLVTLKLFGQQGTTRDVHVTLEYRVKGSSAIFVKEKPYVVNISSAPINLVVDGPLVTNTNQDISFTVTETLNASDAVPGILLVISYPPGFDFKSATPEPSFSNNIWDLGDLTKGVEKTITVNGVIAADAGEERAFNMYTGTKNPDDEQRIGTQFTTEDYIISIEKPFLDLALNINGNTGPEVVGIPGQLTNGKVILRNDFDTKVTDVEIVASFSGSALDPATIDPDNGYYDPLRQEIIWNGETYAALKTIDPGDDAELGFRFKPIAFSGSGLQTPSIDITLSIRGRQASQGNTFTQIDNYVNKKIKYGSSLQVSGNALYYSGPIDNTGSIPPQPGQATTYTIVWNIVNTSSRITGAKARAVLPSYVDWMDVVSPANQAVTYNPSNREVLWSIGTIEPYVGMSSSPKQVNFQVRLNASGSQSGSAPRLVLDTVLTGKDVFTGQDISRTMGAITTRLNLDSNYNAEHDNVQ